MGKDKPPRHVAVSLIYSRSTHRLLMITSRKHPHLWILPKGGIEHGETSGQAAVREAWEEAGTPQNLPSPTDEDRLLLLELASVKGDKREQVWHIHVVEVDEKEVADNTNWPESDERQRTWVTPLECVERIRAWYDDPSAEGETDIDVKKKQKKKDQKGEAMEMALKSFAGKYGWGEGVKGPVLATLSHGRTLS